MSTWPAAGMIACVLAIPVSAGQAPPSDPAIRLMTDQPEYCTYLEGKVRRTAQQTPGPHPEIDRLIHDGAAQCSAGHIRSGVYRLRTALVRLGGG